MMEFQNPKHSSSKDRDYQGGNSGPRNYHIPKIDMRKLDGNDPIAWILQMEQLFD